MVVHLLGSIVKVLSLIPNTEKNNLQLFIYFALSPSSQSYKLRLIGERYRLCEDFVEEETFFFFKDRLSA